MFRLIWEWKLKKLIKILSKNFVSFFTFRWKAFDWRKKLESQEFVTNFAVSSLDYVVESG